MEVPLGETGLPLMGGCQCGKVRYAVSGEPLQLYACHCTECRRQSGSAFGMSLQVRRGDLAVTRGQPAAWERGTDAGNRLACWFCPDCGTRLYHENNPSRGWATVKPGSLDAPVDFRAAVHIWTSRALPGVVFPADATTYPEEPPR